jgi:ABC-2 type transport system permease protein
MTWQQVARKDFEDAVRSKMLWGIMAAFVGFMAFVVGVTLASSDADASGDAALGLTAQLGQLFVPLIALIAGYMAVVGERRTGSLRVLLGYPHSRWDVVMGKLVGRTGVIAVTLGVGSVISIALVALATTSPDLGDVAGLLGAIVLFGAGITGLAVGISASVRSRGKAMALAIGSVLVFLIVWDAAAAAAYALVTGALPGLEAEPWYFLLKRLNPVGAFRVVADAFVDGFIYEFFVLGLERIPEGTEIEQLAVENRVDGPLPVYLSEWVAALTLVAWALVPSLVGYLRFSRSDL